MKLPATFLAALFFALPLCAQQPADLYEARTFTGSDGGTLGYRLLKPKNYDPGTKYPLVLFMHGAGERGADNTAQLRHGAPLFAKAEVMEKFPAFVIAPQCPQDQTWSAVKGWTEGASFVAEPKPTMRLVLGAVDALAKEFSLDPDRFYVTGLSMGGYGTWDLLSRIPQRIAAAAPVCGGGDPGHIAGAKNVPVWAFHGVEDRVVPVLRSTEMLEALEAAGGIPLYSEYPYIGHDSWTTAYAEPQFLPWLFAQRRGQPPVPFATVAGPFEQPPSNQCPGAGPMQSGLWFRGLWKQRRSEWNKAKAADQGAVVFFGDSITQGWGTLSRDFPGLKVANRGISGDTTRGLRTRLQGDVLDLQPRAVSLLIGTNDLDQGGTPEVIAANVKALVAELRRAQPQLPIIINKVMPRGPKKDRDFAKLIPALNELYAAAFKDDPQVTFCDTYALFDDGQGSVKKDEFPDFLHPNGVGYAKWTTALGPVFEKLKLSAPAAP